MSDESVLKVEEKRKLSRLESKSWPAYAMIGVGGTLLIANLFGLELIEFLWPGFIVTPGLLLMWPAANATAEKQSRLSFLAVPGAMMVMLGGLLFAMNLTDHFEAMAYSWTLLVAAAAAGLMYIRRFQPNHRIHERGPKLVRTMGMLFLGLATFFELVVFGTYNPLLPLALIGIGIYMLVRRQRQQPKTA